VKKHATDNFTNLNERFAANLKTFMEKSRVTPANLEKDLGISRAAISYYMEGRVPRADILLQIAYYFGVSVQDMLGEFDSGIAPGFPPAYVRNLRTAIEEEQKHLDALEESLRRLKMQIGFARAPLLIAEGILDRMNDQAKQKKVKPDSDA
jgi:transcriptional regulator with XRE-family HTH domain